MLDAPERLRDSFPALACRLILCIAAACPASLARQGSPEPVARLLEQIPSLTTDAGGGITPAGEQLALEIRAHGAQAVVQLLPLLKSERASVRDFVGFVLRDIEGLMEADLDELIAAHRSGNGWIPPAIARVGTRRAIAFLVEELKRKPEQHTQVTWALVCAGEPAATALSACFGQVTPLSDEFADCVCEVLSELGQRGTSVIDVLLDIAHRSYLGPANRRHAVASIGCIGIAAQRATPVLLALSRDEPEVFSEVVDQAILAIGGPEAGRALAARIAASPDILAIRDVAALGSNAVDAGPALLVALRDTDRDVRVCAARALGYIGYSAAAEALVRETIQADDWKLAYAAVESLGRLRARTAVPVLAWTASHYWYPPVRAAAVKALRVIAGKNRYEPQFHPRNFAFEFYFRASDVSEPATKASMAALDAGLDRLTERELAASEYVIEYPGYGGRAPHQTQVIPDCGIRVAGGLLLASTRGEWGGELLFVKPDGSQQLVLDENTIALHRTPAGIVAVTGLAHLLIEDGDIHRIEQRPDGSYQATWWKRLPGEPLHSGLLDDGTILVSCQCGTVVISPQGDIAMAADRSARSDPPAGRR